MFLFYDPYEDTLKRQGAYLPHWQQEGRIYFVTFRLADSLPREKLDQWGREREIWLRFHPEPLSPEEKAEYYVRFPNRLQEWLDAGYGSMILKDSAAHDLVESAIRHFEGERYELDEFVVSANHVHVLVVPMDGYDLSGITHSWKSYTAKELLKLPVSTRLSTAPQVWQKESWDHLVRSEKSLQKFREYIRAHSS